MESPNLTLFNTYRNDSNYQYFEISKKRRARKHKNQSVYSNFQTSNQALNLKQTIKLSHLQPMENK
jgi:hypothetical protein